MEISVSIVIKALNEQENIAKCIESVLREVEHIKSEILVIDSISTDLTVDIALNYPVHVIQFSKIEDRSCGAAAQLGYQESSGKFIYLIDGDMEMVPGFLDKAINYLSQNPTTAGVGGLLIDTDLSSTSDIRRSQRYSKKKSIEQVTSLGGGGLYRREMIDQVKYFSHIGLRACEEAELGIRLISNGWNLVRLPTPSAYHTGHKESNFKSIRRLWNNGRLAAHGAFLKSSFGHKWWRHAARLEWFLIAPIVINIAIILAYIITSLTYTTPLYYLGLIFIAFWGPIYILLSIKQKSLSTAALSIITWHIIAAASIASFIKPIRNPLERISCVKLTKSHKNSK